MAEPDLLPCPFCGGEALDKTALEAATAEWLNWTDRTAGEGLADHLARAITAYLDALSSLPAQAVGVRLVPLEPTQEMINAGLKRNAQNPHPWLPAVYRAMIALAPSQPVAVGRGGKLVPSAERWPALNVTSEELIRIKNTCVGKEGNVKIWSKMLWMMIEYILDVRAFEKEFQSSPQGETSSLTTSTGSCSDRAVDKGGEAPASPPDPESIASYYASIWGLSNHKLNQLTDGLRKWREQVEAALRSTP